MVTRRWFVRLGINAVPLVPSVLSSCYYNKWKEAVPASTLRLLYPIGGENFEGQSSILLQWEAQHISSISIAVSYDAGATWQTVIPVVPAAQLKQSISLTQYSEHCLIKLVGVDPLGVEFILKQPFKFKALPKPEPEPEPKPEPEPEPNPEPEAPSLSLNSVLAGQTILGGDTINLEWTSASITTISIEYSMNGGTTWNPVASTVQASDAIFKWTVPQVFSFTSKIRLKDSDNTLEVISGVFTIQKTFEMNIADHAGLQTVGGNATISNPITGDAIVFKTANSFLILSTVCTHSGCGTNYNGTNFNCPCHGSSFDGAGNVLSGPANTPLTKLGFKLVSAENKLLIY